MAVAYSGLADAQFVLACYGKSDPRELMPKARAAAQRALELDASCAAAYQWYGVLCLLPQGRLQEAEAAIRHARELDPLSPPIDTSLGMLYFVQGNYDDAIGYFEKALEVDPNFYLAQWWVLSIWTARCYSKHGKCWRS